MRGFFGILSLTVLFAPPFSSAFAASASVHELTGTMTGQYGTAAPQALKIGDTLDSGVTLSTGANSTAIVKFEDGQLVVLAPNTRFAVREYRYNTKQIKDSNILFGLSVDAIDERAAGNYRRFGFDASPDNPLLLFLPARVAE